MSYFKFFIISFTIIWFLLLINFLKFFPMSKELNSKTNMNYKKASKILIEKNISSFKYIFEALKNNNTHSEEIIQLKQKIKPYLYRHLALVILLVVDFILVFIAFRFKF